MIHTKSKVPQLFIQLYNMVQTQFEKDIKRIWFENANKYVNHIFSNFTNKYDIIHEFTYVDTPQQNSVQKEKKKR